MLERLICLSELLLAIATCWLWHSDPLAPLLESWQAPHDANLEPENAGMFGAPLIDEAALCKEADDGESCALWGQHVDDSDD